MLPPHCLQVLNTVQIKHDCPLELKACGITAKHRKIEPQALGIMLTGHKQQTQRRQKHKRLIRKHTCTHARTHACVHRGISFGAWNTIPMSCHYMKDHCLLQLLFTYKCSRMWSKVHFFFPPTRKGMLQASCGVTLKVPPKKEKKKKESQNLIHKMTGHKK